MDTTASTAIGATVSVYVQLLKIGSPDMSQAKAMRLIIIISTFGVALWVVSQLPTAVVDISWTFGIFTAIANVSLTAAGTYGLITGGIRAVENFRAGADVSNPPTRRRTPPPQTQFDTGVDR